MPEDAYADSTNATQRQAGQPLGLHGGFCVATHLKGFIFFRVGPHSSNVQGNFFQTQASNISLLQKQGGVSASKGGSCISVMA